MITIGEVEALIRRQMRGKQSKDIVIDETSELRDLGLSSLQIAEVVFSLEEEHELEFDPARSADAKTLGDLIRLGNEALTDRATVAEGQTGGRA
ncbi:acyl carrier protein [Nocardia halotolerans]|uniref:Acyl carrier protein n=1 Tax=Nocardia halotolerans TaxID=1755878 RepID=A0ABV8VL33_9NOCA